MTRLEQKHWQTIDTIYFIIEELPLSCKKATLFFSARELIFPFSFTYTLETLQDDRNLLILKKAEPKLWQSYLEYKNNCFEKIALLPPLIDHWKDVPIQSEVDIKRVSPETLEFTFK